MSAYEQDYIYHPRWVQWVEEGKKEDPEDIANLIWGRDHPYTCLAGAENLVIEWVEEDAPFSIDCFDGWERLTWR